MVILVTNNVKVTNQTEIVNQSSGEINSTVRELHLVFGLYPCE